MSVTVVALGDSFSCGEGVGLAIRPEQTWTAMLCDALPGSRLVNLSTAGARVRDVRRHQLPAALATHPQVATIMVGLNDVIRSGLTAEHLAADLQVLVRRLSDGGATVLIARWHDPGVVLRLPSGLRAALALRLAWVNQAVDAAVDAAAANTTPSRTREGRGRPYVLTLDLARIPELTDPGAWAVDGIHPSPAGHRAIALSASRILADSGLPGLRIRAVTDLLPMPPGPSSARRAGWLLSHGLPWLLQHSTRVVPAVLSMAIQAILEHPPSPAPVLAVSSRTTAELQCLGVGSSELGAQSLPGRGMTGVGKDARAPEVARTTRQLIK